MADVAPDGATDRLAARVLREAHGRAFPAAETSGAPFRAVRAPGRVNLIGEHTDYNEGFVLPVAIDLEVRIGYQPTDDGRVDMLALDAGVRSGFELADLPAPSGAWHDYVAGTARMMAAAGLPLRGLTGVIASSLPIGAGLSSSAALELASAWALGGDRPPAVDPLELARICQRAENEHVGVRCGLMDQFASACGVAGHALLLDCRSLEWHPVPLPSDLALVIIHSGVPRSLGSSAYNERRADCERAVARIARRHPGLRSLRDVDATMLAGVRGDLDAVAFHRASHVVAENARVADAVTALARADHRALAELFAASHASLRDLYEVSCPELDVLVELAVATPGVVASRMTGGGFGGCTVSLVQPDAVDPLRARIERDYLARTGRTPRTWTLSAVDGAGVVTVDGAGVTCPGGALTHG